MKRLITKHQERILRACHHDHEGLSQAKAAEKLGISQSAISNALKRIEKVMPQLFPILTRLEAQLYHYYTTEGWSVNNIAEHANMSQSAVYKALKRARDKGMCFTEPKGRTLSYDPATHDHQVIYKF